MAEGRQPSEDYEKAGLSFTEKYIWYDPMMLEILLTCITDHFAGFDDCAWTAYHAGHQVALATALQAHNEENPETKSQLLVLAYAMNGYACHYLSDRFAAGHLRPPFKEIEKALGAAEGLVAGILTNAMHDEDNKYGLHVTNKRGDKWIAYGDKRYSDNVNATNRMMIQEALQRSSDEIKDAFLEGKIVSYNVEEVVIDVKQLINIDDYVNDAARTIPMFAYNQQEDNVYRRSDINNLHPESKQLPFNWSYMMDHGLAGWWGLTTLFEVKLGYHPQAQGFVDNNQLNHAGLQALQKTLLANPIYKHALCTLAAGKSLADKLQVVCDRSVKDEL